MDELDDRKLALLVAKDLPGITPKEVEDEFKKVSKHGNPMGFDILTVVGLLVRLAQVAIEFWTKRATEQRLVAELESKAASAFKIDKQMREEIIQRIVDRLSGSK